MNRCIQYEVIKNLRNIYKYLNERLPPSYEKYARVNCNDDYSSLASNTRFRNYVENLNTFDDRYLEFKRIYHKVLIDIYHNGSKA